MGKSLQLFVSHVLRCLPCIYHPCSLQDIVSPVFIIHVHLKISSPLYLSSVYCIIFQNIVPLYLSSMYVHSKLHNIHCQLRSIDLIQSFKISSNKRRERSLPAGPTFSPPTNKELWRPWWRVRELISVFVFISSPSPFWKSFVHQTFLSKYFHGTIWPYISKKKEIAITCLAVVTFLL